MSFVSVRALATKEVQHLLPLILALMALEIIGLLEWFVLQSPDGITWADVSMLLDPTIAEAAGVVYVIVGIVTAYMLLVHETDQRTLQFLWSLPVSRWWIYSTKLMTAFTVLTILAIIGHLLLAWVHGFAVNSISTSQFSWQLWTQELALLIGFTAITLGYGALVACFRMVGIIGFITAWAAVLVLGYIDTSYQYLDPSSLLTPEYRGSEILLDTEAWAVHTAIAIVCVILAGNLWTRDGQPPADRRKRSLFASRITIGLSACAILLMFAGYGINTLAPGLMTAGLGTEDASAELKSINTDYYEISYYAADQAYAELLQKEADQRSLQLQELLGSPMTELTLADLTDNSADHLGIAGWKKLRISPSALRDANQRSHVFVHESAHVIAATASNRRLQDHNNYTLFFNEGLAEWLSYEILDLPEQRSALRLLAALAWERFDLRFSDFLYAGSLRARFDENLIYALGESWVSSLAAVCGIDAPGAALRAMARSDAPQQLRGEAYWRDTLQTIGCNLSAVNGDFELTMRGYQSEIENLPHLNGVVHVEPGRLSVDLTLSDAQPSRTYRVYVRVRDNAQASPTSAIARSGKLQSGETLTLRLPQPKISGERFQYQLGFEFLPGERPFFSRWIDEG